MHVHNEFLVDMLNISDSRCFVQRLKRFEHLPKVSRVGPLSAREASGSLRSPLFAQGSENSEVVSREHFK